MSKFEWQGLDEFKKSEYLNVRVNIETDYKWGSGWTIEQCDAFEEEVYPKLQAQGFYIKDGDSFGGCETLHKANKNGALNRFDKTDIYMHPVEFTGYMRKEDLDKMIEVLSNCKAIHRISSVSTKEVYDLSDSRYEKLMADNIVGIKNYIEDYMKSNKYDYNIGFDFAKANRLPRVGDGSGLSSDDVDIRFIENAKTMLTLLEQDKEQTNEKVIDEYEYEME